MNNQERVDGEATGGVSRPAVHASTLVRSDIEHTFDAFVGTIGAWWPVGRISTGRDRVRAVTVQPNVGGRVFETWDDGTTVDWGRVAVWEPPLRFTMSWECTPAPTEVCFDFTRVGAALTRVTVEHRGWENLTEQQLGEDCASPGGYAAGSYDRGWNLIMGSFAGEMRRSSPNPAQLPDITDEHMQAMMGTTRQYTLVILSEGPNYHQPDARTIVWEHGRRNFALREAGLLAIVAPVVDDSERCGIGLFDATPEEVETIMAGDPGVQAGLFVYEVHPVRSFPGDALPT